MNHESARQIPLLSYTQKRKKRIGKPYPINRIPRGDTSERKVRILLGPRSSQVPTGATMSVNSAEFGQVAEIRAPAEVVDDKSLNAGGFGGLNHGDLRTDAARADHADGGILVCEGSSQVLEGVASADNGQAGGESRGGLGTGDDGDVKAGALEGGGDGSAKVARCPCGGQFQGRGIFLITEG